MIPEQELKTALALAFGTTSDRVAMYRGNQSTRVGFAVANKNGKMFVFDESVSRIDEITNFNQLAHWCDRWFVMLMKDGVEMLVDPTTGELSK